VIALYFRRERLAVPRWACSVYFLVHGDRVLPLTCNCSNNTGADRPDARRLFFFFFFFLWGGWLLLGSMLPGHMTRGLPPPTPEMRVLAEESEAKTAAPQA